MKKIRVLHIISSGGFYGAENVVLSWIAHSESVESSLLVLTNTRGMAASGGVNQFIQRAADAGIRVKALVTGKFDFLSTLSKVSQFIKKVGPQIIHTHGYKGFFFGRMISLTESGMGLVHTNHGFVNTSKKLKFYNIVELMLCRLVPPDLIVVVSENLKDEFTSFGVGQNLVKVLTNSVIASHGSRQNQLSSDIKDKLKSRKFILFAGRLSREKGPDVLIEAMAIVLEQFPDLVLVMAGDGLMRKELVRKINLSGIDNNVLLPGFRNDITEIMAHCQAVVIPSRTEGIPMILLEAMLASKPVTASSVGGIPGVINNGFDGILVAPEDPDKLAEAILRILKNPGLARKIGKRSRQRVKADFNISQRTRTLLSFYKSIYSGK